MCRTMIEADDIYCYDHDMHRLSKLVKLMFHEEYHTLAAMEVELYDDAIGMCDAIMEQVFRNFEASEKYARNDLDTLRLEKCSSLFKEHHRWEKLFRDYCYARDALHYERSALYESEDELVIISELLPRKGHQSIISNGIKKGEGYPQIMAQILGSWIHRFDRPFLTARVRKFDNST